MTSACCSKDFKRRLLARPFWALENLNCSASSKDYFNLFKDKEQLLQLLFPIQRSGFKYQILAAHFPLTSCKAVIILRNKSTNNFVYCERMLFCTQALSELEKGTFCLPNYSWFIQLPIHVINNLINRLILKEEVLKPVWVTSVIMKRNPHCVGATSKGTSKWTS